MGKERKTGTNRKQELDEQPISNNQLFAKLCEVEKLLTKPKVEKGLWTIQDIADYMGFSYGHVFKNIIPDPRFPAPIDIESRTNKDPKKLFVSEEIKAFFARLLKPTKTTKQKRNRNLAEFYGRKWAEVLKNGALRCIAPFLLKRKPKTMNCEKLAGNNRLSH